MTPFWKRDTTYRLFKWYLKHQDELVEQYNGKHLLLYGKKVCGAFDSAGEALTAGRRNYTPGKFIIQRCSPGEQDTVIHMPNFFIRG
jgi:hypothetical protein